MPVYRDLPDRSEKQKRSDEMPTTYAHDLLEKGFTGNFPQNYSI